MSDLAAPKILKDTIRLGQYNTLLHLVICIRLWFCLFIRIITVILRTLENFLVAVRATACSRDVLTSITGGPLGNNVFVFQEISYYWSPNFRSSVANDIDGVG